MEHSAPIAAIAEVIQLSVAPVFLIAGIAALLTVLSTRLHRIIDRARQVDFRMTVVTAEDQRAILASEANLLWRRVRTINWAIRLSVTSALTVCLVIVCLFIGDLVDFPLGRVIAALFVAAMVLLICALLLLLFEVSVSTNRIRQSLQALMLGESPHETPLDRNDGP